MISLRELQEKDAPFMLEWMHDPEIQKSFQKNMLEKTLADAVNFCTTSKIPEQIKNGDCLHFAIVDETDEYLGTISLKNMDWENRNAEYAITTRKKVHGRGIAKIATQLILQKAFQEYGLHRVYLNVFSDNIAANKLYQHSGFILEGESRDYLKKDGKYINLRWYGILESEFKANADSLKPLREKAKEKLNNIGK